MNLILPVLSNALLTTALYALEKRKSVQKIPYLTRQAVIGLLFGILAAFSSEFGIPYNDVIINVRDASPLCAGLIFGAPAGILSGIIGGLYRWFSVYWGAGTYTRFACSISTFLAGVIAAALRKIMFDNKKTTWGYGIAIACVCEDIHMLMIFFTHRDDAVTAFSFVQNSTIPMMVGNSVAVGAALAIVSLLSHEKLRCGKQQEQISQTFQRWLLICIAIAYFVTSNFTYRLQSNMAQTETRSSIELTIHDVYYDITDATDAHLLNIARELRKEDPVNAADLTALAEKHGVIEINLIDPDGVIFRSTNPDFVGYDMADGLQSAEFLCLYEGESEYVQKYQATAFNPTLSRKYAAVKLDDGYVLQVGYSYEQFKQDIDTYVYDVTKNRHIGKSGFVAICNERWQIIADKNSYSGKELSSIGISIDPATMQEKSLYEAEIHNIPYYFAYIYAEGYYIIGAIPQAEATYRRDSSVYISILVEILIFAGLFVLIYFLIKKVIIDNIRRINTRLAQITNGDLNVKVDVRSNAEFACLSDDINSTVTTLKQYIADAAARIDKELEYAKDIQLSALPSCFPPYPEQEQFDIYAQMIAAREVGGDFYDFYMLDDHTVAFLVADVSGKGIPAAMFMMTAKTTIRDLAESGLEVNEIFTQANERLCRNNESGMFVTAWMGVLDLSTGCLRYANAGHNPPLLLHNGETFEYLRSRAGFVLAGMEDFQYRLNELMLTPGDRILLYTDGVTEATDAQQQLYGEPRLQEYLNAHQTDAACDLLHGLKADIDRFVGDAPQFDDITMLIFDYKTEGSI